MDNKSPLVLLGVPTHRDWKARMAVSFGSLMAYSVGMNISVFPVIVEHAYITEARNALVRAALDIKADYLFFIDDDMGFPINSLKRLMDHDKDIVGATYNRRSPPHVTLGHPKGGMRNYSGLQEMDDLPAGVLLIKTGVFRRMNPPWFKFVWDPNNITPDNLDGLIGEDVAFCRQARKDGFEIWCDVDLTYEIVHVGEKQIGVAKPVDPPQ